MNTPKDRILAIRNAITKLRIDAYIIGGSDPHQSEYLADHWKAREWVSGFSGSAGLCVVTKDHAGLWTDGRYFLQAETELAGSGMVLHKQLVQGAPEHLDWLCAQFGKGSIVAIDGSCFSLGQVEQMKQLFQAKDIELVTDMDLIESNWNQRPALPKNEVFLLNKKLTGQERSAKLAAIRAEMHDAELSHYLLTTLDDIAWVLNMRSSDVEYNPVSIANLIIGLNEVWLFIDTDKVPAKIKDDFIKDGLKLMPYLDTKNFMSKLLASNCLLVDTSTVNYALLSSDLLCKVVKGVNISKKLKAIKNKTEIKNIRLTMEYDGAALWRSLYWLQSTLQKRTVSEYEFAHLIAKKRSEMPGYVGESFGAIIGYNANGAIIHYHPDEQKSAMIQARGMLLFDSGGQYLTGTTDITRTVSLGRATATQKKHYTLVLKGMIALSMAQFPVGTRGVQLDILARQHLWQEGLNYGHGTGHGVGYFLNVHEPPQGFIAGLGERGSTVIEAGMVTSNEPGFYLEGQYGIRIENLILTSAATKEAFGMFHHFETLTLFPFDSKLIEMAYLNESELQWIAEYTEISIDRISEHLDRKETARLVKYAQEFLE